MFFGLPERFDIVVVLILGLVYLAVGAGGPSIERLLANLAKAFCKILQLRNFIGRRARRLGCERNRGRHRSLIKTPDTIEIVFLLLVHLVCLMGFLQPLGFVIQTADRLSARRPDISAK